MLHQASHKPIIAGSQLYFLANENAEQACCISQYLNCMTIQLLRIALLSKLTIFPYVILVMFLHANNVLYCIKLFRNLP